MHFCPNAEFMAIPIVNIFNNRAQIPFAVICTPPFRCRKRHFREIRYFISKNAHAFHPLSSQCDFSLSSIHLWSLWGSGLPFDPFFLFHSLCAFLNVFGARVFSRSFDGQADEIPPTKMRHLHLLIASIKGNIRVCRCVIASVKSLVIYLVKLFFFSFVRLQKNCNWLFTSVQCIFNRLFLFAREKNK